MEALSIIIFFLYTWSFGFLVCRFVKESENFLERNLMRIGIGLGVFIFIGFIFNLFRIPLDWRFFFGISILILALGIFQLYKQYSNKKFKFKISMSNIKVLILIIIFLITFNMYHKGAFSYPYLEDDDPWNHALGTKFVSIEKTVFAGQDNPFHYIDPYPPSYEMVIGILHQTNDSVQWTLKFFNALFISLSVIFFYFFTKEFTKSQNKALFAAFALAAIPAFLSHFIWALALTMPLIFVSFYSLERINTDRKWWIVSAIVMVATLTSSPTHSTYFGFLFLIYVTSKIILEKKVLFDYVLAGFAGLVLSFVLWWLPMLMRYGPMGTMTGLGYRTVSGLSIEGTADRVYNLNDFIWVNTNNMINNPVGIGFIMVLLVTFAIVTIIYKNRGIFKKYLVVGSVSFIVSALTFLFFLSKTYIRFVRKRGVEPVEPGSVQFLTFLSEQTFLVTIFVLLIFITVFLVIKRIKEKKPTIDYMVISMLWLIFTFYAVKAGQFHFKLSPFRAWMLLAIPVSILAAEGLGFFMRLSNEIKLVLLGLFEVVFIFFGNNLVGKLYLNVLWSKIPLLKLLPVSWFFIPAAIIIGYIISIFLKNIFNKKIHFPSIAIIIVFVVLVLTSSGYPKYTVNTAEWPPGGFWTSNEEIGGYIWLKDNIPTGSKVFTFSSNALIIGFDKYICAWCKDVREYQVGGFEESVNENYKWLKERDFRYIIVDGLAARTYGTNETNIKMQELIDSSRFKPVFGNNGMVIFEIL